MAANDYSLINNEEHTRFEFRIGETIAFINYIKRGDVYYLVHTQVPEELQGQGIAGELVEKTFRFLEDQGDKMMPFCPYVQSYLKRHPEWNRLVAGD